MIGTPVEVHRIGETEVLVKREDLASSDMDGMPPFSKIRGLAARMKSLRDAGTTVVGYAETAVSMAGWGISAVAREIGATAVIFDPQYANPLPVLIEHRRIWRELGATVLPVRPNMGRIVHATALKMFKERWPDGAMLDQGLPLRETLDATEVELRSLKVRPRTVVLCVGSGAICAGLLRASGEGVDVVGVLCYAAGSDARRRRKADHVMRMAGVDPNGFFVGPRLRIVDVGLDYLTPSEARCPFGCNRWYDLKAWQWLTENVGSLEPPVLFWNIGSEIGGSEHV